MTKAGPLPFPSGWNAALAIGLGVLWIVHLLNPYLILASAFLFSTGFAFGSPAHSSVIAGIKSRNRSTLPSDRFRLHII